MDILNLKARYLFGVFYDTDDKKEVEYFYEKIDDIFDLFGNESKLKNKLQLLKKILENIHSSNSLNILMSKLNELDDNKNNVSWYEWKVSVQLALKFEINNNITIGEFIEYEKIIKKMIEVNGN